MSRIPREVVDAVRERTDIVEVVQRHVALTRKGTSWVGLCPFHQEKTPSFNVVPSKGIYHCFGCSEGGDVFRFLMRLEGLSFFEAVVELAGPAGVTVETRELTPAERKDLSKKATLYDALEAAAAFYEGQLWTAADGKVARAYLDDRAITRETARTARLGWAPAGWTRLVDHLHNKGIGPELAIEAGLAKEGRGVYDAFRERIVFPIRDDRGRVIGFGGRILEGDGPKYLNSPETRLYEKSRVLYGLYEARNGIQRADRALVVEGYFDVLAIRQAGFAEVVANCGTALTQQHLERLRPLTRNVVLVLDADEAGSKAAERALPLAIDVGIQPWRLQVEGAKDPDELIREHGPQAMADALEQREPLVEWVVQRKLSAQAGAGGQVGAMSRERILEELLPLLGRIPDTLVSRVAARLGVHEASLRQRVKQHARPDPTTAPPAPPDAWKPERDLVHVLWLLVHRRAEVADIVGALDPSVLAGHPAELAVTLARLREGEPVAGVLADLDDAVLRRTLQAVVAREKLYEPEEAALGCSEILVRLTAPRREEALRRANREIASAASRGDTTALRAAGTAKQAWLAYQAAIQGALDARDLAAVVRLLGEAPAFPEPS